MAKCLALFQGHLLGRFNKMVTEELWKRVQAAIDLELCCQKDEECLIWSIIYS